MWIYQAELERQELGYELRGEKRGGPMGRWVWGGSWHSAKVVQGRFLAEPMRKARLVHIRHHFRGATLPIFTLALMLVLFVFKTFSVVWDGVIQSPYAPITLYLIGFICAALLKQERKFKQAKCDCSLTILAMFSIMNLWPCLFWMQRSCLPGNPEAGRRRCLLVAQRQRL